MFAIFIRRQYQPPPMATTSISQRPFTSKRPPPRNRGTILVLENKGKSPTRVQQKTIATIRPINPNWMPTFYFQNKQILARFGGPSFSAEAGAPRQH
jgi:hypothetical protein